MNKKEYEKERDELLERWKRENKYDEQCQITSDGPSDWDKWMNQKPRILFLLKEALGDFDPCTPEQPVSGIFGYNISRWKLAIKGIYENSDSIPAYLESGDIHENYDDIAIVEVKKIDEGKGSSDNKEIMEYAKRNKEFLKKQIDLIDPQVILCGNTYSSYQVIYDIDAEMAKPLHYLWLDNADIEASIRPPHKNRMIIDFYHPSYYAKSSEKLFELLCTLLKKGNVFEKFDWNKQSK